MYPGKFSSIIRFLLLLLHGLALAPAHALDPTIGLSDYRHERWGEVEGAPGLIDAMAQTEDGWLWLAGRHAGLFRFDGVRFIAYTSRDGSRLQQVGISAMQAGADNALWIGHGIGGVSVLHKHRIRHVLTPDQTSSVFALARGRDDVIWAATRRGLYRIAPDKVTRMEGASGYDAARAEYVMADSQGRVWASDGNDLYLLEAGQARFRKVQKVESNPLLLEAADGSVWLVIGKRFDRLTPAAAQRPVHRASGASSYQSAFDKDGNLWTGNCPIGLCVVRQRSWQQASRVDAMASEERLDQRWQMTSLKVLSVLVDREGSLWVGTAAGVDRLRDQPVHMIEALTDRGGAHALPHPDGRIVVLETRRLNGMSALWNLVDGKLIPTDNPLDAQLMVRAADASLVLAGKHGIERQYAGHRSRVPLPPVVSAPGSTVIFNALAAANDTLWVAVASHGVWRFSNGKWTQLMGKEALVRSLAIDKTGRLLIGDGSRLLISDGDAVLPIAVDAADIGRIQTIHVGEEIIVSGTQGAGILRNRELHRIRFSVAKDIGGISGGVRDATGTYWLNSAQGLLRITASDWTRSMRDLAVPIKADLLDALDGYTGGGESIWLNDTAFLTTDGKLWLAGERGLAWIEPDALRGNPLTADVEILGVTSSGRRYRPGATMTLGDGVRDVQIDYSSPSLRLAQRVRFRYRMVGVDREWVDAGTRRSAFYQNLAPGRHTFEVVAFNESGVPSTRAGTLIFEVTPRVTETWWFYGLCAAAVLAILLALYRMRMRHLATRLEERFEIRASERESVARSLHDTFLQSLQGLFFSLQAVMARLPPDSPARKEFDALLERAQRVLVEGRDEVKGLRSQFGSAQQFWELLRRDIGSIVPEACARVELVAGDGIDLLQPQIHHNVYAVVREAVVNALRHTSGTVLIHTVPGERAFIVSVTDHGDGLGRHKDGKPGHFGLQGMREHAAQIGARLEVDDAESGGTRVTLTIPGKQAYASHGKLARVD